MRSLIRSLYSSLAFTLAQAFEQNPTVTEVIVVSSIPLVFHHSSLAELADRLEVRLFVD